uniref:Uncharacterized protein n=1 Tax=Anopheles farauti TaxID=69004 RepID=A0A182QE04_9DIPT
MNNQCTECCLRIAAGGGDGGGGGKSRFLEDASLMCNSWSPRHNGDIFSGLNDGILSRAEALAAVDIGKHQNNHPQMATQLKHDVMYHHGMGAPPQRPLQHRSPAFRIFPVASSRRRPPPSTGEDVLVQKSAFPGAGGVRTREGINALNRRTHGGIASEQMENGNYKQQVFQRTEQEQAGTGMEGVSTEPYTMTSQ